MWRVDTAAFVDEWPGETTCPAPPPTTTAPPTTTPPTTIDPVAAEEALVTEAAVGARRSRLDSLINLDDPTAFAALETYYVLEGPAYAEILRSLSDLRNEGWRVRANEEVADSLTVEEVSFEAGSSRIRAELVVCIVDTGIVYEPASAPDGSDTIVDDSVGAFRTRYIMALDSETWKLVDYFGISEWEGETSCPAAD